MPPQTSNAPSGPRGARNNQNTRTTTRGPSGGIQKRSHGPLRTDKDGDLDMDAGGSGRGNAARGPRGRGADNFSNSKSNFRTNPRSGATMRPINAGDIQKAISRGVSTVTTRNNVGIQVSSMLREAASSSGRHTREKLDDILVRGWSDSKAVANPGGCIKQLLDFLERKASPSNAQPSEYIRIEKSRPRGDTLIISVRPEDVPHFLRLDSFTFAGAPLSIELSRRNGTPEISNDARELKGKITAMLTRRYNAELKLLDLSALGNDSEFANTGMFETHSRQAKFFPALMRVCDMMFSSHVQKKEAVLSVTLANNTLPNLATVTTLAETFPDLKNLDLSNNNFKDLAALSAWRWKFRSLDHLVLTGNPIETQVPNYQQDMLKWFPTLRSLNTVQVRSDAEIAEASKSKLPLPTLPASFRDEGQIAENFVKHFFSAYDSDRSTLANGFYDPESTFSLSVNISAPRAQDGNQSKAVPWDAYIKKSRNLIKITSLPARMSRSLKGVDNIRETWLDLPTTRHPDLFTESEKWCIECHSLPSLPDQSGQVLCGVGGLIIMAHGEFGEVDVSTGSITAMRSFDRTFILGPGAGIGGIRVVNDILVVRAYGGHEAWKSTEVSSIGVSSQIRLDGLVLPDEGFGVAIPGKPNEQLQKEVLAIELSKATRMTLEYSGMCLEQSGWNLENASKMFEEAKANIPPSGFY